MKLSEAVKCYEECFGPENSDGAGGCLYENCPLHEEIEITAGGPSDEGGQITWKIEGCSLLGRLEEQLKDKVPGMPMPELIEEDKNETRESRLHENPRPGR